MLNEIVFLEEEEAEIIEGKILKLLKILRKIIRENQVGHGIIVEYPTLYHFNEIIEHANKILELRENEK